MKKFLVISMSFIFVVLCSCTRNDDLSDIPAMSSSATKSEQQIDVLENTIGIQPEISTVVIKTDPNDLYSYFIKDRYEKIYEAQKSEGSDFFTDFDKHALDVFYFIYDIDGNGVDELIMGDWKKITDDIDDINPPREILISSVYTIENGEVVKQDSSVWWDDEYLWNRELLSNGLIRTTLGDKEYPSYSYLGFENGKLELKLAVYNMGDRYLRIHDSIVDEEEITKEEFERLRDEANGDSEIVEINWKRIDEYGK